MNVDFPGKFESDLTQNDFALHFSNKTIRCPKEIMLLISNRVQIMHFENRLIEEIEIPFEAPNESLLSDLLHGKNITISTNDFNSFHKTFQFLDCSCFERQQIEHKKKTSPVMKQSAIFVPYNGRNHLQGIVSHFLESGEKVIAICNSKNVKDIFNYQDKINGALSQQGKPILINIEFPHLVELNAYTIKCSKGNGKKPLKSWLLKIQDERTSEWIQTDCREEVHFNDLQAMRHTYSMNQRTCKTRKIQIASTGNVKAHQCEFILAIEFFGAIYVH